MSKTPKELYEERDRRISDAIRLRIPDRIPLNLSFGYFPATYTRIPFSDAWYNCDRWLESTKQTLLDLQPDGLNYLQSFTPGKALEHLDLKALKWPGYNLPDDVPHQYIEDEWMKSDEYDAALKSLSDYMLRVFYPRISEVLAPLKMLPAITSLGFRSIGLLTLGEVLARPEVAEAVSALQEVGREYSEVRTKTIRFSEEIERLGFPVTGLGNGVVPFDAVAVLLRGTQGILSDLSTQPEKLLKFCEYDLGMIMDRLEIMVSGSINQRILFPLHQGNDGLLSLSQFKKFYWPSMKKIILAFIDQGLTPCTVFTGKWSKKRLEYVLELPKGKILCQFPDADLKLAKEVLGGHSCIMGGPTEQLLRFGTPQDVTDFCKNLIDTCGKDGGFIMTNGPVDYAKPENVKNMIEFTKDYGAYR